MRQPTPALQRQLQLGNSVAEWNVELSDRPLIESPVWLQAVPVLEVSHTVSMRIGIDISGFQCTGSRLQVTQQA